MTLWTVAHQAPLSKEVSRQEHWSGLPIPTPGDLPNPGIKLTSLASCLLHWQVDYLPWPYLGSPINASVWPLRFTCRCSSFVKYLFHHYSKLKEEAPMNYNLAWTSDNPGPHHPVLDPIRTLSAPGVQNCSRPPHTLCCFPPPGLCTSCSLA